MTTPSRLQSPMFKFSPEVQPSIPNSTIVYYSIPPKEPEPNTSPSTTSSSSSSTTTSSTTSTPSSTPSTTTTTTTSGTPIATWNQASDKVEQLLRGLPSTNWYKVSFSEPVTFHYWRVLFKKDFPATTWQITGDKITVEFDKFGTELVLLTPISGRNFEFKVTAVPHYNVEVSLKITRGMTVMCSLAADSLMDAKFIVEGKEIPVNGHLLAARSDVLKRSLLGSMKEGITKEILITDASYEAVRIFLHYMAVDKLESPADAATLIYVYKLAHRYLVPMIQDETTFRITNLVDKTNYVSILQAAQHCQAQQIISAVLQKVLHSEYKDSAEQMSQLFV